jgi:hypothetical protein
MTHWSVSPNSKPREKAQTRRDSAQPEDLFAYIAAIAAHPAYTEKFQKDLSTPGLRIPFTADAALFKEVAALGKRIVWLHSYGERMADDNAGRPSGAPRAIAATRPTIPKEGAIAPDMPLPDELRYDEARRRLHIVSSSGTGFIDHVAPAVWRYEVDGKQVIPQWFSHRKRDRSKPSMGDKRPPSPLQSIQPEHWLHDYTSDLMDLLNVLTLLVETQPEQARLLEAVCSGALLSEADLRNAGFAGKPSASSVTANSTRDEKQQEMF